MRAKSIAAAILVLGLGFSFNGSAAPVTPAAPAATKAEAVTMYVMPQCGYCEKARDLLTQRGVPWSELDIVASPQAKQEFDKHGGRGTPLLVIGGEVMQGVDPARLDALLRSHGLVKN
ncbi:glutaredoxin [Tahibacter aquaticus]|uniref:Glutaredoxin n=1 Tax=Tahibacter aquaticus TaxID=520092 RepID=A0A4R6YMW2_9GAMM|nr:glutaredoxin domain-containing protein [Tahibacter aquaticus]TDR38868.1 glutaredoxin [Tahibacter aquaticus]